MNMTEEQADNLYHAVNLLLAHIGFEGGVSLQDQVYLDTMDALYEIDGGVYNEKRV